MKNVLVVITEPSKQIENAKRGIEKEIQKKIFKDGDPVDLKFSFAYWEGKGSTDSISLIVNYLKKTKPHFIIYEEGFLEIEITLLNELIQKHIKKDYPKIQTLTFRVSKGTIETPGITLIRDISEIKRFSIK